jgi:hypothetical protein
MAIDGECSRCKRSFSNLTEHTNNVHKLVKDASHKKSYKPTKSMVGKSVTVRISAIAAGNVAVVGEATAVAGEVDSGAAVAGEVGSGAATAANTERQRRKKTKNERQRRKKKVLAQKPRLERENASERIRY